LRGAGERRRRQVRGVLDRAVGRDAEATRFPRQMSPAGSKVGSRGGPAPWRNPLRDKQDKRLPRIAGPCGMVIFGVTGDLARKKVMPAIYDLANRGLLPPTFSLVGFARRDWSTQDFGDVVHDAVKQHCRTPFR